MTPTPAPPVPAAARIPRPYRSAPARAPRGVTGGVVAAAPDGDVVVFLIGMRINRWRAVRTWFPVFGAMPRMIAELTRHPADGLLGARNYWSGRVVLVVQYWRSLEELGRYAHDPAKAHRPAWARFNARAAGGGDVGIFHETYRVAAADVESTYGNMPAFGLALAHAGVPYAAHTDTDARRAMAHEPAELVDPA